MRIALFGGSFDPVHKEHMQLVKTAIEELGLDKLFVLPAFAPPHKPGKELSPDEDRMEMCRLAFEELPCVEVSDYEIERKGTSYTYLTCKHFRELYPDAELFWLVGTDMLRDFPTWKNPQEILTYVTLAVCGRAEEGDWEQREQADFFARFGVKFCYLSYNGAKVSSTNIRVLAGAGMRVTDFTPPKVAAYIEQKGLYKIPFADRALALEKPARQQHSLRVACLAASRAVSLRLPEKKVITAALMHDCGKNIDPALLRLEGFTPTRRWGKVPSAVWHQYAGAYLAKERFGVKDRDILRAIRYHTSGRENMSDLEKLIFLADMLEEERCYAGVEELRRLFWQDLDACLRRALQETVKFLKEKGGEIYPLTLAAEQYYSEKKE